MWIKSLKIYLLVVLQSVIVEKGEERLTCMHTEYTFCISPFIVLVYGEYRDCSCTTI